jgi:enoyl-[acyl-carrier protein] reductase II
MIEQYIQWEKENMPREQLEELTMGSARKAAAGDIENGSVMAGQVSGLINEVKSAQQIVDDVLAEAKVTIKNVQLNF